MILNRQAAVRVNLPALRTFERRLRAALRLGRRRFDVGLVSDRSIWRLNAEFRGKRAATDVLSFPWRRPKARRGTLAGRELEHFLGDVVISASTARRNARREGHSTLNELRWLMLHGALHLLGYDHEKDQGQMTARELALRAQLRIGGRPAAPNGRSRKRLAKRKRR
jgi:probable rRNA maturation factor